LEAVDQSWSFGDGFLVVGIDSGDCFFDWEWWSRAKLVGMAMAWMGKVRTSIAAAPM
jgi:hypothetical protein